MHWICRIIEALARIFIHTSNLKCSNNRGLVEQIEDITALKIAGQALNILATILMQRIPLKIIRRISAVQKANILRVVLQRAIKEHLFIINILRGINNNKDQNQVSPQQVTRQWPWDRMLEEDIQALRHKITMRVGIKFYSDLTDLTIIPHPNTQDSTIRLRKSSVIATNIAVAFNILKDTIRTTSLPLHLSIIRIQDSMMIQWAAASPQLLEVVLIEWISQEE